jgi:poly(A)-specific ribonuclease
MDFNKWIYKGIPYLNAKAEKQMLENLSDSNINLYDPSNPLKAKNINLFKDGDKQKYEDFCKNFSSFLYSEAESHLFEKYPKFIQLHIINNMQESIRKRLYFSVEKINGAEFFMITKCDEETKKLRIQKDLEDKVLEVRKAKGFRSIFEAIVSNKKIVVGHNCMVDVNFVISHFGDQLPSNYNEWKKLIQSYFDKYVLLF